MKRIIYSLWAWACLALAVPLYAQQSVTISGSDLTDAMLFRSVTNAQSANTNYNTYTRITATAWTSGSATYMRTLLRFNLSAIPQGSIVQSATLYLNSDPTKTSSSSAEANSQLSGSNAFYLEKVSDRGHRRRLPGTPNLQQPQRVGYGTGLQRPSLKTFKLT